MYQFDTPFYFYFFGVLPVLWLGFYLVIRWKRKAQLQFTDANLMKKLSPYRSRFKPGFKLILLSLSISFLVIGLVNPKIGTQLETVKSEDIAPNRLEKSKRLVSAIMNQLASDRIGIIAYAAQAIPQLPITTDYGAGRIFLQALNTDMLSSQGTALDAALDLSGTFFDDEDQTNRVVFLISDGEDHSEEGESAAKRASALGIRIFTFGVGTEQGAPIPIKKNGIIESYKKNLEGETVITKRNEEILKVIAEVSGGEYIDGNETQEVLDFVSDKLKSMDKKEFEAKKFVSYKDQFQAFLLAGFLLLLIEIFLFETKTKWVQNLNLFNEK
jgi:Ca-activated chloride channel family protein